MKESLTDRISYWMIGWLYDFKEPWLRVVFLPIMALTFLFWVIPLMSVMLLHLIIKPEDFNE